MDNQFAPAPGAAAWAVSNPPTLSLAPMVASLEIFAEVGMSNIRARSVELTRHADQVLNEALGERVRLITPATESERGAMLSLEVMVGEGRDTYRALQEARIACDWRYPNVIRVAPAPLYNGFDDIDRLAEVLASVVS